MTMSADNWQRHTCLDGGPQQPQIATCISTPVTANLLHSRARAKATRPPDQGRNSRIDNAKRIARKVSGGMRHAKARDHETGAPDEHEHRGHGAHPLILPASHCGALRLIPPAPDFGNRFAQVIHHGPDHRTAALDRAWPHSRVSSRPNCRHHTPPRKGIARPSAPWS